MIRTLFKCHCDIYLAGDVVAGKKWRLIYKAFAPTFDAPQGKVSSGFLGLDLPRLKAISVVTTLRDIERMKEEAIYCLNIPTCYRDRDPLPEHEIIALAEKYARKNRIIIGKPLSELPTRKLFLSFPIIRNDIKNRTAYEFVRIDVLSGEIWSTEDYLNYMYDFNNIL